MSEIPTRRELIEAYGNGFRFMLFVSGEPPRFALNRAEVDRVKQTESVESIFYLLPDAQTRPCAKGRRLAK